MGKTPKGEQQVTEYSMGLHFGVALELDAITRITVNEKVAWEGRSDSLEVLSINRPDLYGGNLKGGGLVGKVYHLPGRADQVLPESLANLLGTTSANCVAYRGITSVWFTGNKETEGFIWGANNPLVAQTMAVTGERAPKTLDALDPASAMIGPDANPAHIIFECMTSSGLMANALHRFNVASFAYAAEVLADEEFGLSLAWMQQTTIQEFVSEILDHIQGVIFLSPRTGLWTLKLLRDDYAVEDLRVLSPDNAKLTGFKRALWGELTNELTVTWTNPINEQDETYTAHDLGAIQAQDGQVVSTSRNYYGIRRADLAMKVAWRDVRASSAPLATGNVEVDRRFWNGEPGEVLVLNWPEQDLYNVVCRVMAIDYGRPGDSSIKLSLLQDIFSLEKPILEAPPGTGWIDPSRQPEPLAASEIITVPYYFVNSGDFSGEAIDLEYPEVISAVLGYQDDTATRSFNLMSEDVSNTGLVEFQSHGVKPTVERILLPVAWDAANTTRLPEEWVSQPSRGPQIGGFVWAGALYDTAMEILHVIGFDDENGEWILARGALDTIPKAWTVGTPLWFVNPGMRIVDSFLRSAGEDVSYKLLSRTSLGTLPIDDAPVIADTLGARPHLPLRPANFKINGVGYGLVDVSGETDMVLTWATRNRTLEDGQVLAWTDGSVPPEYAQATMIKVFDASNALIWTQSGLWTQDTFTIPKAWFARWGEISIYALAVREGFASLQAFGVRVVGLPNDPGAAGPPDPVDFGPPPSPDPAPAEGAWSVVGHKFDQERGGEIPAIVVAGLRDRSDAVALVVRYKLATGDDWYYLSEVGLTDEPTQVATTAVRSLTKYDVEIAYHSNKNVLSLWRSLGEVTTGRFIADDTANVGKFTATEVEQAIENFNDTLSGIADLVVRFEELDTFVEEKMDTLRGVVADSMEATRDGIFTTIRNTVARGRELAEERDRSYVNGVRPNAMFEHVITITDGLAQSHTMLSAEVGDNKATYDEFVTTQADVNSASAATLVLLTATVEDNAAEVSDFKSAQSDANKATATSISGLTATVGSNKATTDAFASAQATTNSTLSNSISTLTSNFSSFAATVASTYVSYADLSGAIASYDNTIKAWSVNPAGGGNPLAATVASQGTAIATATGQLVATAGLIASAGGIVSGMKLYASTGYGTDFSGVIFQANKFQIQAGSGATTGITPFTYDSTTGTLFVENITLRRGNIQGAAISTCVGFDATLATTLTTTNATLGPTLELTLGAGADVFIDTFLYAENTDTANGQDVTVKVFKDGVLLNQKMFHINIFNQGFINWPTLDKNVSGYHNYTVQATSTPGTGSHCKATSVVLRANALFHTGPGT